MAADTENTPGDAGSSEGTPAGGSMQFGIGDTNVSVDAGKDGGSVNVKSGDTDVSVKAGKDGGSVDVKAGDTDVSVKAGKDGGSVDVKAGDTKVAGKIDKDGGSLDVESGDTKFKGKVGKDGVSVDLESGEVKQAMSIVNALTGSNVPSGFSLGRNGGSPITPPSVASARRAVPAARNQRPDPLAEFKYRVEISGITEALFTECTGLTMERETVPYEEGGTNNFIHKFPGRVKYTNVTLKRGMTLSKEMWRWFEEGLYNGKVDKRSVTITLYARDGSVAQIWNLANAYPVKWTGPNLKADSTQAAIETLELVHHGISRG